MAINLQQLESTGRRWGAPTQDYPQGRFLNGSGSGSRDGSYAKAEWANEIFGVFGAILTAARMKIDGTPETATKSQVLDALKTIIKNEADALGGDPTAAASGSSDAISASFTQSVSKENGKRIYVRAAYANRTTYPTLNVNGTGATRIVKGDNRALAIGDIQGSGYWMLLIYDVSFGAWVLQNPASGTNVSIPNASTSTQGIIAIATSAEVANGTNTSKAVTPKDLKDRLSGFMVGTGDAGTVKAYETVSVASTVTDNSARSMSLSSGGSLSVSNGSYGKSWITVVALQGSATINLGSSWAWQGSSPTLAKGLVTLAWYGDFGVATFTKYGS